MKLTKSLKIVVYSALSLLYLSGFTFWILDNFFTLGSGHESKHHPAQYWVYRIHGTVALMILVLIGYVLRGHVVPSWKARHTPAGLSNSRNNRTGLFLTFYLLMIALTVPGLMFITVHSIKDVFEQIHTYMGLALILPFFGHIYYRFRKG